MATQLSAIETQARRHLVETTASFWTSAELIDIINRGIKDMWGAVIDLHQEHFLINDTTSLSIASGADTISGIPVDCFRVHMLEPANTSSSGNYRNLLFVPRDQNSREFISARTQQTVDPLAWQVVYYHVSNAGPPVGAITITIAPKFSGAIAAGSLRLIYVPTVPDRLASDNNPIPGESDMALIAWCVAYGRAKEREDRSPDPNWLAVYATEKQGILTRLTPRQTQEPEFAEALFESLW